MLSHRVSILPISSFKLLGLLLGIVGGLFIPSVAQEPVVSPAANVLKYRELLRIDAPIEAAALKSVDGNGSFAFEIAPPEADPNVQPPTEKEPGETLQLSAREFVSWGHPAELRAEMLLLTSDGSILVGSPAAFTGDSVQLQGARLGFVTNLFDEVTLPLEAVRGIVFQPPADTRGKDKLLVKLAKVEGAEDVVFFSNGDELTGTIRGFANGKLALLRRGPAGGKEVELTLATPSGAGQVAAVAFNPALGAAKAKPGMRMLVGFEDGSLVTAEKLWRDDEQVRLELSESNKTTLTCNRPAKLVSVQPLGTDVTYLSDLSLHSYKHIPFLTLTLPYYEDRSASGDRLRSDGKLYNKGLGIPSAARLTYVLDKPYRRFEAELAMDDVTGMKGSVVCRVYLNVDGVWKPSFESEVIRGGDKPVPISVDLTGAKAITLIVDYADRGDEQDLVNWLNARLVE